MNVRKARIPELVARFGLPSVVAAIVAVVTIVFACVPADTRPEPASLLVTVGASELSRSGVVTADGWTIAFDRVLVAIGRTTLSSSCARYSDSSYDRVLELSNRDPQKVSVLYAIGHCDFRFRVGTPSADAIVGEGATEADKTAMRTRGADRWVNRGGVVLDVTGVARRADEEKTFHFVFRSSLRYSGCSEDGNSAFVEDAPDAGDDDEPDAAASIVDAATDGEPPPPEGIGVVLDGGAALVKPLTFDMEELFLASDGKTLRFDPYAAADTDRNGAITLDELARVPIATVFDGGPFETSTFGAVVDAGRGRGGRTVTVTTLGDYVYVVLLPRLLRYGERGACASGLGVDYGRDAGDAGDGGDGGGSR